VTDPKFAVPAGVLGALDHRAEFDETLVQLHDKGGDPYVNSRDFYLQRRQAEIDRLKGRTTGTVGGMTEAPTGPVRVRPRSDAVEVPAPVEPVVPVPTVSGVVPVNQ
jgi:phospholipid-binding lipoprotein MlaA